MSETPIITNTEAAILATASAVLSRIGSRAFDASWKPGPFPNRREISDLRAVETRFHDAAFSINQALVTMQVYGPDERSRDIAEGATKNARILHSMASNYYDENGDAESE